MSHRTCPQCSSSNIEVHDGRGETICMSCGTVLEESTMVEGLQFSECSNGSMQMVGHFVPSSGVRGFALVYGSRESREHVLQRGYHNLQRIADQLRLSSSHIESAQRVFLMAVQRNFTIGRNNMHVASACLYAICRREKTPHMLIDFSDVLQTPVKVLGQVFMKLLRLLRLHVPNIDPSMFMERFAVQMNLGDKTHMVAATGVRIVQALTRNWITTGRRPTGLCGAALLISARYHGIPVSSTEISQIVRISSPTLLKRLAEFKHTSTAQLTADEFESIDLLSLPIMRGPPCFEKHRLKDEFNKVKAISGKEEMLAIEQEKVESMKDYEHKDNVFQKQKENLSNINDTDFDYLQYEGYDFDEVDKDGTIGSEKEDIETNFIDDGLEGSKDKLLSFPKFLGGIELDINQDKLCEDEPTSQDITVIASKLINAIDKAKENASQSITLNTENKDNEDHVNNTEDKDEREDTKSGNLNEVSANNLIVDPLHFLLKGLNEENVLNKECNNSFSQKNFSIFSENNFEDAVSSYDISTTISSISNGNRDEIDNEIDRNNESIEYGDYSNDINRSYNLGNTPNNDLNCSDTQEEASSYDDLSEISDSEINDLLLDEDEREAKRLLWDEITKETLPSSWIRRINREKEDKEKELAKRKDILEKMNFINGANSNQKSSIDFDFTDVSDQNKNQFTDISLFDISGDEKDKTNTVDSKKRKKVTKDKEKSKSQKVQPENAIESVLMALKKTSPGATKHVNSDTLSKLFTVC